MFAASIGQHVVASFILNSRLITRPIVIALQMPFNLAGLIGWVMAKIASCNVIMRMVIVLFRLIFQWYGQGFTARVLTERARHEATAPQIIGDALPIRRLASSDR